MDKSLRVIDANLNRAREGLRTAEEYARLVLEDAPAAQALKDVRKHVQACTEAFGPGLLAARDIEGDPGTRPEADDVRRGSERDIAAAGLKRAQEALRVVEEFAQLHSPAAAGAAAKARYAAYQAEQSLFVLTPQRAALASPVMVVFSNMAARDDWRDVLASLLDAGARLFQLREKDISARNFVAHVVAFKAVTRKHEATVIINDRADVAAATGANGVHLGQDDLDIVHARKILGPNALIGISTHDRAEALDAQDMGADYVGIGAMFHTDTKKVQSLGGPALVSTVRPGMNIPVFCIGGIRQDNVAKLVGHGARHIAVSSALLNASDPGAEYLALCKALGERA
ncbi:MAG: thiamine phosphate synthase [Planctomycetes bacterium]|nr:thiamine phosphate synthase [Planctomycetota bacterium]